MTLSQHIRQSYRDLQQRWTHLADQAFGKADPASDETARGEFISAFITERDLTFPRAGSRPPQG